MALKVDLNADMGESFGRWTLGDDAALMPHLTSASIACGFHGGDPHVMRETVGLAVENGVGIGAHIGLPDLLGFGRRRLDISAAELHDYTLFQVGALKAFAEAAGGRLQHVKPHGTLYWMVHDDADLAQAVVDAIVETNGEVILLGTGDQQAGIAERAGVPFVREGYVDLDYNAEGRLVLERVKKLRDPQAMAERALRLVTDGKVATVDDTELEIEAHSICVHGDAPNAPAIAGAIRNAFEEAGVELAPLTALNVTGGRT